MKTKIANGLLLLIFVTSIFFSCKDLDSGHPPYEDAPKEIISVEQAREMYDAYSKRRVPIIKEYEDSITSDSSKFEPTRYAEYDLETVKQYIAYIEHEAKQANVGIKTLRFYLSNYPNSDKFSNGDAVKYPRRNTFFVVPTMDYNGENVGFSIEEIDGKYTAVPIKRRAQTQEGNENKTQADSTGQMNEAGFFATNGTAVQGGGTTSLILNDSDLTPPPGTDDFGNN